MPWMASEAPFFCQPNFLEILTKTSTLMHECIDADMIWRIWQNKKDKDFSMSQNCYFQ